MRSKTSLINTTILRKDIIRFWPLWTLVTVYLIIVGPLLTGIGLISNYYSTAYMTEEMIREAIQRSFISYAGSYVSVVHIAIIAIVAAVLVFSYLNYRVQAYMLHSMPVTRKTLFCTHFLSGFLMAIVPLLVMSAILGIMNLVVGAGMGLALLSAAIRMILMMIFFYCLAVLVCMVSGHGFMSVVIYGVVNCFVLTVYYMYTYIGSFFQIGGESYSLTSWGWKFKLTPAAYFLKLYSENLYDETSSYTAFHGDLIGRMSIYLIPAVIFFVLALYLYKKRPMERVGETLAFTWCIPVFKVVFTICATLLGMTIWGVLFKSLIESMFGYTGCLIVLCITMVIIVFGTYILAEMIIQKRFMVWKNMSWIILCIMTICMLAVLFAERGVYKAQSVPKETQIESVRISGFHGSDLSFSEDREVIQSLNEIHKSIRSKPADAFTTEYDESKSYISFTYHLKNGQEVYRYYYLDQTAFAEELEALNALLTEPSVAIEGLLLTRNEQAVLRYVWVIDNKTEDSCFYQDEDLKYGKEIYEAMLQDVAEGNFDCNVTFSESESANALYTLDFEFVLVKNGVPTYNYSHLSIGEECVHTIETIRSIKN